MSKVVDLEGVRRGKASLRRAVALGKARGSQSARPVPVAELIAGGRLTLTVPELATLTGLHQLTIRRAIAQGELKAANGGGRSQYRISCADAESWWRGRGGGTLLGAAGLTNGQADAGDEVDVLLDATGEAARRAGYKTDEDIERLISEVRAELGHDAPRRALREARLAGQRRSTPTGASA